MGSIRALLTVQCWPICSEPSRLPCTLVYSRLPPANCSAQLKFDWVDYQVNGTNYQLFTKVRSKVPLGLSAISSRVFSDSLLQCWSAAARKVQDLSLLCLAPLLSALFFAT